MFAIPHWILPGPAPAGIVADLRAALGLPPWLAELFARRGFAHADAVRSFLHPRLAQLADPFLLPGMDAAVTRLLAAIDAQERIVLYGDYDVDGVTSLTLLTRVLRACGADVAAFLPHRVDEGYGLTADGIDRCMAAHRPQLLVAVDCGTTSIAEIRVLRERGVDVIILDHHEPRPELPEASALVNPKLGPDFRYLCSAGIAFKTAHALLKRRPLPGFDLKQMLDLVAVGTVADIVPLIDENRTLVKAGLERLAHTAWPGLRALCEVAGLRPPFTTSAIGFGIGPRLNAAGRLASAEASLELLLTDDPARAQILARLLDQQNRERRALEEEVFLQADAQVLTRCDPASAAAIAAGAAGWHPGVIGIVASRLQRRYHRPVVVVGFDPMGMGKGSGRSIEGLSLIALLGRCAAHLEKFGGHEMAAGLTMRHEFFDEFSAAFALAAAEIATAEQLTPRLRLDAELRLDQIDAGLLDSHEGLRPFGAGNRQPLFLARRVNHAAEPRLMKEKHYSFLLRQARAPVRAVWWNAAENPLPEPPWDIVFTLDRNEWNGRVSPQIEIRDARPAAP